MNQAMLNIKNWLHENQMESNIKKTHALSLEGEVSATLNRSLIVPCTQQRDLGRVVPNNLSWKANCERRTTKTIRLSVVI